jgi:hypothetical protein
MNVRTAVSSFAVEIDGRKTSVEIVRSGSGWTVRLHGFVLSSLDLMNETERSRFALEPGQKYIWEWQMQPSDRSDEFLARTRFKNTEEAMNALNHWLEKASAQLIERLFV